MKPLDEHLRDASSAWLQDARPTLVATEESMASAMRPSHLAGYLVGGLGTVAIVVSVWMWTSTPDEQQNTMTPSTPNPTPAVRMEYVEPLVPPASVRADAKTSGAPPSIQPSATTAPALETTEPASVRFRSDGTLDGFTAEYERILGRAMKLEAVDPLRAASEYLGLGKLCMKRGQYAHAVSSLQRAEEIARRGQFDQILFETQTLLDQAQARL